MVVRFGVFRFGVLLFGFGFECFLLLCLSVLGLRFGVLFGVLGLVVVWYSLGWGFWFWVFIALFVFVRGIWFLCFVMLCVFFVWDGV